MYNIFYIDNTYGDMPQYEATTNNFELWLKNHNERRISKGNDVESADDFDIREVNLVLNSDTCNKT